MALSDDLATIAKNLLDSLSPTLADGSAGPGLVGTATLQRLQSSYDPFSGEGVNQTPSSWEIDVTPPEPFAATQINGTSIKQGDFKLYCSAQQLSDLSAPAPDMTMVVQFNGSTYSIVGVYTIYAGNTPILYQLHCRR